MARRDTRHRLGGMVMVLGGLVAVGCGGDDPTDTRATLPADERDAAVESSITDADYVWVSDGRVVAVRRAPVPDGAYGAHGVDYSPATAPA
jgi:hypothetical protein